MTDTPIHDELQHFLDMDTGGGVGRTSPLLGRHRPRRPCTAHPGTREPDGKPRGSPSVRRSGYDGRVDVAAVRRR